MPKHLYTMTEPSPLPADGPATARPGSGDMLRELCSLGLTQEASLGILRFILGSTKRRVAHDPSEW